MTTSIKVTSQDSLPVFGQELSVFLSIDCEVFICLSLSFLFPDAIVLIQSISRLLDSLLFLIIIQFHLLLML